MSGRSFTSWAVLLAALASGGCELGTWPLSRREAMSAWAVNDMVALTDAAKRFDDELLGARPDAPAVVHAAANETVSLQLVVEAGAAPVRGLHVTCGDLVSPDGPKIAAANVRVFRMLPIRVEAYPAWYLRLMDAAPRAAGIYDPLVPVDLAATGRGLDVPAGGRLALWVDLYVPRDAGGGTYRGELALTSRSHADWKLPLVAKVFAFVLPETRPVPAVGGFDHRELFAALVRRPDGAPFRPANLDRGNPLVRQGLAAMRQLMRLAHDHRLDLFDSQLRPLLKRDAGGQVRLDWGDYDAIALPYLDGTAFDDRIGCAAWPLPVCDGWPDPGNYGGADSPQYGETVRQAAAACRAHFAAMLKGSEQLFFWPLRNPRAGTAAYAAHQRLAGLVRRGDPNTPLLCQLSPAPPAATGWAVPADFARSRDILAAPWDVYDPSAAAAAATPRHPLAGAWLAPAPPPYLPSLGLAACPADVRAVPWLAMKYGCTGLFLPDVLHWSGDPMAPLAGTETRLFYPGAAAGLEGPLPSVRLKRLRRGLQDLAYLWVLQRRGQDGVARAVLNSLARYAGLDAAGDNWLDPRLDGWVADGATWLLARRLLGEEAQAVVSPESATRAGAAELQLAWSRFNEATRSVRVEQVRSTVEPAPGDGGANPPRRLRITLLAELYNEFGRPADVTVELGELPEGYTSPARITKVALGAAERATAKLTLEGPVPPPIGPDGRVALPLHLRSSIGPPREMTVGVPLVAVAAAAKTPAIDGSLDDWPLRMQNTARDFRLLGRRGRGGDGLARRQTMVFLLRDERNLYVAFRCSEPNPEGMVVRNDNTVRYDQLMAGGEDMVELLLDGGSAAAGPEDLFHMVVKPNGVLVAERGVGCRPPLGKTAPWLSGAAVATGRQQGCWVVEMAIPLASFGPRGREGFWRVNFMRYAVQGAESSSWSGAARHYYDPRNLGTMFVGAATGSP